MKFLRRFSSSDRDAVVVLVLVIVVSIVLFPLLSEQNYGGTRSLKNSRAQEFKKSEGTKDSILNVQFSINLRPFDPNTASEAQLLSLGLSRRQVRNVLKYRSRGGRYHVKEDFARVYGLTLEKYRQLEPYITIAPQVMAADVVKSEKSNRNNQNTYSSLPKDSSLFTLRSSLNKLRFGETVDINTADTTMLKRIPGIGSYYAMRIVELRKRRQMFSSPEELLSIREFPETALEYMTASQDFPVIYINLWSQKQLSAHPLLNYTQARDIINLRRLSGTITRATDLAALPSFNAKIVERITPFLRYDTIEVK